MIERISQKIMDILEADSRLLLGGNAYATGWSAVTREDNGDTPAAGSVNLFDRAYDPDATTHRPAVYVGTKEMEADDRLDYETHHAGNRLQYRIVTIPLVLAVAANGTKRAARAQRNQLRHNIMVILLDNYLANGYWYLLDAAGDLPSRVRTSGSGGNDQQVAEGIGIIACQCHYSWSATASA